MVSPIARDPSIAARLAADGIARIIGSQKDSTMRLLDQDGMNELVAAALALHSTELDAGLDACAFTHSLPAIERRARTVFSRGTTVCYARATSLETHGTHSVPIYDVADGVHPQSLACYETSTPAMHFQLSQKRESLQARINEFIG